MDTTLSITTDDFHFYSHANGLAFTLYNRNDRSDLFWQGDDAAALQSEIEAGENAEWPYDKILTEIWHNYSPEV